MYIIRYYLDNELKKEINLKEIDESFINEVNIFSNLLKDRFKYTVDTIM